MKKEGRRRAHNPTSQERYGRAWQKKKKLEREDYQGKDTPNKNHRNNRQ
jgi:hypothetical protein